MKLSSSSLSLSLNWTLGENTIDIAHRLVCIVDFQFIIEPISFSCSLKGKVCTLLIGLHNSNHANVVRVRDDLHQPCSSHMAGRQDNKIM
jgi:hypothetical protein